MKTSYYLISMFVRVVDARVRCRHTPRFHACSSRMDERAWNLSSAFFLHAYDKCFRFRARASARLRCGGRTCSSWSSSHARGRCGWLNGLNYILVHLPCPTDPTRESMCRPVCI